MREYSVQSYMSRYVTWLYLSNHLPCKLTTEYRSLYAPSMRLVLQRVSQASVSVDGKIVGSIGPGYLILLCILRGDTALQAQWLAEKVTKLRLFDSSEGKVNDRSLLDIGGEILVISQFTLAADIQKGNRPDYTAAAAPEEANILYEYFMEKLRELQVKRVSSGLFGAMMSVQLTNDGPVTLTLEK